MLDLFGEIQMKNRYMPASNFFAVFTAVLTV